MAKKVFKASPIHVVPIFASLLISIACAFLILESTVELVPATILPEAGYGPIFNAVIFVCAAGFGATLIYFFLKRGVHWLIRLLMGFTFSVVTFSLATLYFELLFVIVSIEVPLVAVLTTAFLVTAFVVVQVFFGKGRFYEIIVLAFGGATGTMLGASIPVLSAVVILLLLAVYDVFAVFHGPVGKIASKGLEHLPGASFAFKNIHVGLGDLTFYSMLVSRVLLSFGWLACSAATLGVLLGSFLSFKMVEQKEMFPGLPFSISFGLLGAFLVAVGT